MTVHQLSIELTSGAYRVLQKLVASGAYGSESEALEDAVFELEFARSQEPGSESLAAWQEHEIKAAIEEDLAHPEWAVPAEELEGTLARTEHKEEALAKAS